MGSLENNGTVQNIEGWRGEVKRRHWKVSTCRGTKKPTREEHGQNAALTIP
jgi:hypothetical protein